MAELQPRRSGAGLVSLLLLLALCPSSSSSSSESSSSPSFESSFESSFEPGVRRRSPDNDGGRRSRRATSNISGYPHANLQWYTRLKEMEVTKVLGGADFKKGTYRIKKGGRYQLAEDIVFAPNAELTDKNARFCKC